MEKGADKTQSAIHHFSGGDVGGLMNVSGAAVLKGSRNQAAAQKFLAFLVSKSAQEMLSKLDITFRISPGRRRCGEPAFEADRRIAACRL